MYYRVGDIMDDTMIFGNDDLNVDLIENTLKDIYVALEEKGYNPIDQIVGYLLSGDPGYISSYKDARKKVLQLERVNVLEVLVRNYLEK